MIKLESGKVSVEIERDNMVVGTLTFCPDDVGFVEKFYAMMDGMAEREKAMKEKELSDCAKVQAFGGLGKWIFTCVDDLFGAGSSQMVFGDTMSLAMFKAFFEGISPYITNARDKKVEQYLQAQEEVMM